MDLAEKRKVSNFELVDYINELGTEFDNFEISVKKKLNLDQLWESVYESVNTSHKIPINLLTEKIDFFVDPVNNVIKAEGSINIILIGDSGVGKTNLFSRYFQNKFEENFITTIGLDKQTKLIKYKNKLYKVNISDTAGQERFRSLPIKYYKNADGALLLFDVADNESFQNVELWMQDIKNNSRSTKQALYLIGNKIDLPNRVVSQDEAKELAEKLKLPYYEMSCKLNINIYEIISRLIVECLKDIIEIENGFKINKKKKKSKKNGFC